MGRDVKPFLLGGLEFVICVKYVLVGVESDALEDSAVEGADSQFFYFCFLVYVGGSEGADDTADAQLQLDNFAFSG